MSTKISQLTSATDITASDLMQIVDVEDGVMAPSGTNKKITAQLLADDLAGIVSDGSIATSKLASGALPSGVTVSSTNLVNGTIVDADINASAAIAGSKISPSFTTNSSVTVDSSSTALSITQSGAGANLSANGSFSQFLNDGAAVNLLISTAADSNQPAYLQYRKYRGTHASPTAVQDGDVLGSSVYYGYDGNSLESAAFFGATVDGAVSDGIIPTRFGFSTENSSGVVSEKMRITSEGNVGIGTTSPSQPLQVNGNVLIGATPTTQYSNLTVVGNSAIQASSPILNFVNAAGSTRFGYLLHSGTGGDSFLLNQENGSIRFGTNNSEGMRITSAGNVGIATTTPSSKLHVAGDLTMSSATVATSATAGTNGDVPAQVAGYLVVNINGTARKIPYYA